MFMPLTSISSQGPDMLDMFSSPGDVSQEQSILPPAEDFWDPGFDLGSSSDSQPIGFFFPGLEGDTFDQGLVQDPCAGEKRDDLPPSSNSASAHFQTGPDEEQIASIDPVMLAVAPPPPMTAKKRGKMPAKRRQESSDDAARPRSLHRPNPRFKPPPTGAPCLQRLPHDIYYRYAYPLEDQDRAVLGLDTVMYDNLRYAE